LSDTISELVNLFTNPVSCAVMLWVGIGPGALAAYLQASGQQSVPPAQARRLGGSSERGLPPNLRGLPPNLRGPM